MKFAPSSAVIAAIIMGAAAVSGESAESVATDPVGFVRVNCKAASDTSITLPLTRPPEFAGTAASVAGNVVTVSSVSWVANDWTYGIGANPSNTYYVLVTSGASEGAYYTITGNSPTTLTVDPNGAPSAASDGFAEGDQFKIIPYWTLNTAFPNGSGIKPSPDVFSPKSTLLFTSNAAGVNLPLSTAYFYHDGSQAAAGWYIEGNLNAGIQNDVVLNQEQSYVVRNSAAGATSPTLVGAVSTAKYRTVLSILAPNKQQDHFVGLSFPIDISLSQTGLQSSPAFVRSADVFNPKDVVILHNNTAPGINKPLGISYFYHDGTQAAAGWYIEGNLSAGVQDTQKVIKAGEGFVIRKARGPVGSNYWTANPPY
jgi:uncharacterized protein (TIGR02597 family)